MSRSQETQAFNTGQAQNQGYYSNSQNSYSQAQTDVGDYENQLAAYKAGNPYVQGGQFQTATNQQLANTNDAAARSAGAALQGQALRTGQNTAGSIAATENMQQQNTRNLGAEEADATQQRIAGQAGYNQNVLNATAVPEQMEASLSGQQANAAGGALGTEQKAGETPSWMDELGAGLAGSVGQLGSAAIKTFG